MQNLFRPILSLLFVVAGVFHFAKTEAFVSIMPSYIPWHRELVLLSGIFEILGGLGILFPPTRRWACYGLIALLIAVFPANINMAVNSANFRQIPELLLWLRLPLQFIFIALVWIMRR